MLENQFLDYVLDIDFVVPSQVWDVISNQEAVQIISSTPDKEKSARRLVECAALAWKHKKRGIATDDISAICLFFHASPFQHANNPLVSKFSAIRKSG